MASPPSQSTTTMSNTIHTDELSTSSNVQEETYDVIHNGKSFECNSRRLCDTAQSIIMYDKEMGANARFVVNKVLTKLILSGGATDEQLSKELENHEKIAVEHYINRTKELEQSCATAELK
ncbi:unnamed protein product [Rotaria sp. Silwood1]|nr:unnamed protein product [Rotaria sp. Silwood1]